MAKQCFVAFKAGRDFNNFGIYAGITEETSFWKTLLAFLLEGLNSEEKVNPDPVIFSFIFSRYRVADDSRLIQRLRLNNVLLSYSG